MTRGETVKALELMLGTAISSERAALREAIDLLRSDRDAKDGLMVVRVQWDDTGKYISPPIGPFCSQRETDQAQTALRKRLRSKGRKWHRRVRAEHVVSLDRALGWSMD